MGNDDIQAKWAAAIEAAGAATEGEMRDCPDPWPKTAKELAEYTAKLVDRPHDYGTCCYAMSLAAVAAFNYVASALGVTGFQASCADLDFLRRTRRMKHGFMILDGANLLYPQDDLVEKARKFVEEKRVELAAAARAELAKAGDHVSPGVIEHWKMLATLDPKQA